ncbi:hypothetical protein NBH00_05090 [Paraconexibacter antarcticus]|uniref:DUF2116 family Zn-ribbon domain-containing protein n=1 Tax=Paraconexibacter antarcticus TaxID=2949664 RepID=A0ABY5DU77_9ACTN|nr:hypothetical protein [Paraconexibacter antarcticus]UTI65585.1 hypothetical protein NBH00_05090 [Paraconexibacter antarcticus]
MKTCLLCDRPLPPPKKPGLRGPAKYCSTDCREEDRRKKPQPVCLSCGRSIAYVGRGRPRKYCNNACFVAHRATG